MAITSIHQLDDIMKNPKESDKEFEQLKLLFEYTKFHILLYTTLITLLIGLFAFGASDNDLEKFRSPMKLVTVCFIIAGGAGGVIGSSIPFYNKISVFLKDDISPYNLKCKLLTLKGQQWINIEHSAFWYGILIAVGSFLLIS